ncbi:MAG: type II toxin-antitoxin system VapC family toxin [Limisphaerales bacterium]
METIYIETTVVSYLVANPSRDSILAAHQQLTRQWWQDERQRYQCVTSREVLREAGMGDAEMSRRRAEALAGLTVLKVEDSARKLARAIVAEKILPPAAVSDAVHAVVASQYQVNILLTWNCRHLANPHSLGKLREFMARHGLVLPEICTPIELVGE